MRPVAPILLAVSLVCASAQTPNQPSRGPDGRTEHHVSGIDVLPIPGKPFTSKSVIDWSHAAQGEGEVTTHGEANVARDSQGRVYRELRSFIPVGAPMTPHPKSSTVLDPVNHTRRVCDFSTRVCLITNYRPQLSFQPAPAGPFDKGRRFLTRATLGTNTVESLTVEGTRETTSIVPGTVGNDQTLNIVDEYWYSPDLQTNLLVLRKDPREGDQIIRLANVLRAEPDPQIFAPPKGFNVIDTRRSAQPAE
jgi:hypothetical protein